jgi:hypothetical protein
MAQPKPEVTEMHTVSVFQVDWEKAGRDYIFRPTPDQALAVFEDPSTSLVAEVTYPATESIEDALEFAYMATNTLHQAWYESTNPRVKVHADGPCRSTSAGDIMAIGDALFLVAGVGFTQLHSPA